MSLAGKSRRIASVLVLTAGLVPAASAVDMQAAFDSGARAMGVAAPARVDVPEPKAVPAAAKPVPDPFSRRYRLVAPPSCKSLLGMDVEFVPAPKAQLDALGIVLAAAHPSLAVPVVVFDRDTLSRTPPEFQRQVLLHECAHKSLGLMSAQEKEADCEAARRLQKEHGYGRKEFGVIAAYTRHVLEREEVREDLIKEKLADVGACYQP